MMISALLPLTLSLLLLLRVASADSGASDPGSGRITLSRDEVAVVTPTPPSEPLSSGDAVGSPPPAPVGDRNSSHAEPRPPTRTAAAGPCPLDERMALFSSLGFFNDLTSIPDEVMPPIRLRRDDCRRDRDERPAWQMLGRRPATPAPGALPSEDGHAPTPSERPHRDEDRPPAAATASVPD